MQLLSVHGNQVIAFAHLHAGLGQRGTQFGVPVFSRINFLDTIAPARLVELVVHAEQADIYGMKIGIVAAANIGM